MSWLGPAPDRFHPEGRRKRNRDLPMRLGAAVSPGLRASTAPLGASNHHGLGREVRDAGRNSGRRLCRRDV